MIKGNIATVGDQILKGAILIGDNGQNGFTRTLLSADPSIQVIGTVDDAGNSTHTLILYVIAAPSGGAAPTLNIGGPVGSLMPLASLSQIVGRQNATSYLADISGTTAVGSITNSSTIITAETIAAAAAALRASSASNNLPIQAIMQQAISNMGGFSISSPGRVSVPAMQDVVPTESAGVRFGRAAQTSESKSTSSQAPDNASTTLAQASVVTESGTAGPARQILVQIQTAQGIELVPRSQVSSDSGLNFKIPTAVLTTLQVSPTAPEIADAKAPVLFATLADGTALPSWIQFDPVTQTFSATQIPSDVQSVTIKLQSKQGQEVIGESILTISAN